MVDQSAPSPPKSPATLKERSAPKESSAAGRCSGAGGPARGRPTDRRTTDGRETSPARSVISPMDDCCTPTATFQEDHRRCERRDPRAKNTINTMVDQLDPSPPRSPARGGGRHRRKAGRAGRRPRRRRHVEGPDQIASNFMAGTYRPGPEYRRRDQGGRQRRPVQEDHRRREGRNPRIEKHRINTTGTGLSLSPPFTSGNAREVGTEGRLGGQADVKGAACTWKDPTDSVNSMAGNLTSQVRNIAGRDRLPRMGSVQKITVDVKGEILELKNTINTMVDRGLILLAAEVMASPARSAPKQARRQADVRDVAGTWKDLTDNVNSMAGNLTGQVRNIAAVTTAVANGDLSKKITVDVKGGDFGAEEHRQHDGRPAQLVQGSRSHPRGRARSAPRASSADVPRCKGVSGTWKDLTDNVNFMAGNLTSQVRGIAKVVTAVANGDPGEADGRGRGDRVACWPTRSTA